MLDEGRDTSGLFYTPEEYLATIDYISAVKASAMSSEDGIEIRGNAFAGEGVDVEYKCSQNPVAPRNGSSFAITAPRVPRSGTLTHEEPMTYA